MTLWSDFDEYSVFGFTDSYKKPDMLLTVSISPRYMLWDDELEQQDVKIKLMKIIMRAPKNSFEFSAMTENI